MNKMVANWVNLDAIWYNLVELFYQIVPKCFHGVKIMVNLFVKSFKEIKK
jgi:hypothetical protein